MTNKKITYLSIENKVNELLEKHYKNIPDVTDRIEAYKLPIDLNVLLESEGISIEYVSDLYQPVSLARVYSCLIPSKKLIIINTRDDNGEIIKENQLRFSIALELGHWFLHSRSKDIYFRYSTDSIKPYLMYEQRLPKKFPIEALDEYLKNERREELQANHFAFCLLTPAKLFFEIRVRMSFLDNEAIANKLVEVFNVSKELVFQRTTYLLRALEICH